MTEDGTQTVSEVDTRLGNVSLVRPPFVARPPFVTLTFVLATPDRLLASGPSSKGGNLVSCPVSSGQYEF